MKILVVYDSLFGNTEKIAQSIVSGFGSEHQVNLNNVTNLSEKDLIGVDLLIVGSPTHGGWPTEPIKLFLNNLTPEILKGKKTAAFDTSTPIVNQGFFVNNITKLFGRAAKRIAELLEKKGAIILDAQSFIVTGKEGPLQKGELARAKDWATNLIK